MDDHESGLILTSKKSEKERQYKESLYFYWREVQRKQLGFSANLFFLFASGILAFSIKELDYNATNQLLIQTKEVFIVSSLLACAVSIVVYGLFSYNRLCDFRNTAKLYKERLSVKTVSKLTIKDGQYSWRLFKTQLIILAISFFLLLIYLTIKHFV